MIFAPSFGMKGSGRVKVSAVDAIESLGDIPAELHMLLLVHPHRDKVRLVKQNIRRHQNGVGKQARRDIIGVLFATCP